MVGNWLNKSWYIHTTDYYETIKNGIVCSITLNNISKIMPIIIAKNQITSNVFLNILIHMYIYIYTYTEMED